ncbi:MAG: hypothetical protein QW353_02370 [Candidatus Korarchaeum sp.]
MRKSGIPFLIFLIILSPLYIKIDAEPCISVTFFNETTPGAFCKESICYVVAKSPNSVCVPLDVFLFPPFEPEVRISYYITNFTLFVIITNVGERDGSFLIKYGPLERKIDLKSGETKALSFRYIRSTPLIVNSSVYGLPDADVTDLTLAALNLWLSGDKNGAKALTNGLNYDFSRDSKYRGRIIMTRVGGHINIYLDLEGVRSVRIVDLCDILQPISVTPTLISFRVLRSGNCSIGTIEVEGELGKDTIPLPVVRVNQDISILNIIIFLFMVIITIYSLKLHISYKKPWRW